MLGEYVRLHFIELSGLEFGQIVIDSDYIPHKRSHSQAVVVGAGIDTRKHTRTLHSEMLKINKADSGVHSARS